MALREPTPGQMEAANDLFDQLVEADQTYETLGVSMGWSRSQVIKYVQVLRDVLAAQADTISVTCDPDPLDPLGPWIYTLRGGGGVMFGAGGGQPAGGLLELVLHTIHGVDSTTQLCIIGSCWLL